MAITDLIMQGLMVMIALLAMGLVVIQFREQTKALELIKDGATGFDDCCIRNKMRIQKYAAENNLSVYELLIKKDGQIVRL